MEHITTREAARRLGISQTQVRRLVRNGSLPSIVETRPRGSRILVAWNGHAPAHASATPPDTPEDVSTDAAGDASPRADDVERLHNEVASLRQQVERGEEERAELRRMLNLEQQMVGMLRAQLPAPRTQDEPVRTHRTPHGTPRRQRPSPWQPRVLAALTDTNAP